jgi:putative addiction module component (TIGR02574 family)
MNTSQINEILKLNINERINLIELIWESISSTPEKIELTQLQKEELDERLKDYYENPDDGISWNELLSNIKKNWKKRI